MTITLPIPDRRLSPNARVHWRAKSPITKKAKMDAFLAAMIARSDDMAFEANAYRLTFYWPDKRGRDDDNAASSFKAYRDGIAAAFNMDDRHLKFHGPPEMLHDKENPRLVVELFTHPR